MFFLMRAAFWLCLVGSILPFPGREALRPGVEAAAAEATASVGADLGGRLARACRSNPAACLDALKVAGERPSGHTLRAEDLAPTWGGARRKG